MPRIRDLKAQLDDKLEQAAYKEFCRRRWPSNNGKPICPKCGHRDKFYTIHPQGRSQHGCYSCPDPACDHQFTPTAGTIFHGNKRSYATLMMIIEMVEAEGLAPQGRGNRTGYDKSSGISALELKRRTGTQYKSAYVLWKKLRACNGSWFTTPPPDGAKTWKGYWQRSVGAKT